MNETVLSDYENWKEDLPNRYLPATRVEELIFKNSYSFEVIGNSFEDRPIYKLNIGKGKTKILLWSQMHGNESTATRAMFDIWKLLHEDENLYNIIDQQLEIHFIPQLNPDGAEKYTRRNATNIDINRDFVQAQSPEMRTLKDLVVKWDYDFLFNLHDQRTIFHPKNSNHPASLSFLAPVTDSTGAISTSQRKAIQLISCIIEGLQDFIPNQIARFSDDFYPKATGDNFQKLGYPTILIECGHFPNDYKRNQTRKFTSYAILKAFEAIIKQQYLVVNSKYYYDTPINDNKALDIIYRDVQIENAKHISKVDIGILFRELLENDNEISFNAEIVEIGDLSDFFGHDEYHAENRVFESKSSIYPEIGNSADFQIGEWNVLNGVKSTS